MENFYEVRYSFISMFGEQDGDKYVTPYFGDIYEVDAHDCMKEKLIGRVEVVMLQMEQADFDQYDLLDIFESDSRLFSIGELIMNFETGEVNDDIQDFYEWEIVKSDLCIIQRIELIAPYRGKGIGKKVLKDIYNRFSAGIGLFVVRTAPLQFERDDDLPQTKNWHELLEYDQLDQDYEKAYYKLKSYFQKIGFNHINGYEELMFLNPMLINHKLNAISL